MTWQWAMPIAVAIALGLAAFGLYCFAWARYVRQR